MKYICIHTYVFRFNIISRNIYEYKHQLRDDIYTDMFDEQVASVFSGSCADVKNFWRLTTMCSHSSNQQCTLSQSV